MLPFARAHGAAQRGGSTASLSRRLAALHRFDEFSGAIKVLTAGAFSRCVTTMALTSLCPIVATLVVSALHVGWAAVDVPVDSVPIWLIKSVEQVPEKLPETCITTVLLMLRPFAQDKVAQMIRRDVAKSTPLKQSPPKTPPPSSAAAEGRSSPLLTRLSQCFDSAQHAKAD